MHEVEAKSILTASNGMNIYRGCTHGCIYCDARSTCYQINHEFEDIQVKVNAPDLLEQTLRKKRKKCMIGTGGMSDPYIQLEEKLGLTRSCLEIIDRYGFGLTLRDGDRQYYYKALDQHFPGLKERYMKAYGNDYGISPPNREALYELLVKACKHYGMAYNDHEIFAYMNKFEDKQSGEQISLFP